MHDPDTRIGRIGPFSLWHHDPCCDGSDDSCGWFMRARHGDPEVLRKIEKAFEFDWDRVYKPSREDHDEEDGEFQPTTYLRGYFKFDGSPNFSLPSITLNLFFVAACEILGRRKALRFLSQHLVEIMIFGENPVDSLRDNFVQTFGKDEKREERIHHVAACIYAWIIRESRPWWKHPRWHVWHWRVSFARPQWMSAFSSSESPAKSRTEATTQL